MRTSLNNSMRSTRAQIGRHYRQIRRLLATGGVRGVTGRMRKVVAEYLLAGKVDLPVLREDVLAADLSRPRKVTVAEMKPGDPFLVNWVIIPAGPKSGGHTTIFRIIRYLESHGFVNRVYFYNVFGGDHAYYESFVRSFYGFNGFVGRVEEGMADAHAAFATGWATAYPVFNQPAAGDGFYFVQDYEPFFHPVGAVSLLAENTYRMGFHAITAGRWLAEKLRKEFGMAADFFDFGCDGSVYQLVPGTKRSGVVFYARPEAPRRGFELGLMAMEIFAARRPEIDIHLYGDTLGRLPFRHIDHGRLRPEDLNQIYNRCFAGLSLSLTNVSLVPHEMLAAGCIPVVNDAIQNRIVLNNDFVRYAPPTPHALASALEAAVMTADFQTLSQQAAASVKGATWEDAGAKVAEILRGSLGSSRETWASTQP